MDFLPFFMRWQMVYVREEAWGRLLLTLFSDQSRAGQPHRHGNDLLSKNCGESQETSAGDIAHPRPRARATAEEVLG